MSRTNKKSKAPGYEYYGRRPYSRKGGVKPGRIAKDLTHRAERNEAKRELNIGIKNDNN